MRKYIAIMSLALLCFSCKPTGKVITIFHTNDTHSCIEAEKNGGAGVINRALLLEQLADSIGRENMLLFDSGDFSQGSLYYNVFKGEIEIEMMNAMGYDACAIGNHEFDFGLENMARIFKKAKFPVLCANYDFSETVCEGTVQPYTVIEKAGRRIGVFGLSPDPNGLVGKENYMGVKFLSPIEAARTSVEALKRKRCDVIVCLSHLGWKTNGEFNDERLVAETSGIDIVLGGHSHDYFEKPLVYTNSEGKSVIMQQMGKNGRNLGWVRVTFE